MGRPLSFILLYFLFAGSCGPSVGVSPTDVSTLGLLNLGLYTATNKVTASNDIFPFGVASGDPLPDAVIIWSMLDPAAASTDSTVVWQLSEDAYFKRGLKSDTLATNRILGYSLKADVTNLSPNTTYYYRFGQSGNWSVTGRTRTAPDPDDHRAVKLAVVSCNALEWGFFNAFENIALREELNAVIHLGDYIYEYATGQYGDTTLQRIHQPRYEVLTQADYHQRYAQYRSDPQLKAAHAAHPFICVWDDHEVANNSYGKGAENHDVCSEGDYLSRMTAAKRVYYNWMPIREKQSGHIYRSFSFGGLADLHMLDERLSGRDAPANSFATEVLMDSCRSMLGTTQFDWLCGQLRRARGKWQLLGNQVLFAPLDLSNILPQYAVNLDAWDGYAYEQKRLVDTLRQHPDKGILFLTGDTHCSWVFEIKDDQGEFLAHELGTPSVSSANYDEFIHSWDTMMVAQYRLYRDNDHLQYANIEDHGYLLLHLKAEAAEATFHFSESVRYPTTKEKSTKSFTIAYEPRYLHTR